MDFLRVTYYVRLAMTLRDQYPAMRAHLEQVRLEPDPFMAATMFAFFFEVMLQERPPPDEGSEQSEVREHLLGCLGAWRLAEVA